MVKWVTHPTKGRCVIATQCIQRDTLIMEDPVVIVGFDAISPGCPLDDYPIQWTKKHDCIALGLINLINHSKKPNVRWERNYRRKTLRCYATTRIKANEELVINYACKLWFKPVEQKR